MNAMSDEQGMIAAWQEASEDLGIAVVSPHLVDGESFPVHVPLFGSPVGALPVLISDQRYRGNVEEKGYFVSLLNPEVYCKYDRGLFIETLVDWGWFGSTGEAPAWYACEVAKLMGTKPS
jgi:hypothetical protein